MPSSLCNCKAILRIIFKKKTTWVVPCGVEWPSSNTQHMQLLIANLFHEIQVQNVHMHKANTNKKKQFPRAIITNIICDYWAECSRYTPTTYKIKRNFRWLHRFRTDSWSYSHIKYLLCLWLYLWRDNISISSTDNPRKNVVLNLNASNLQSSMETL